MLSNAQLYKEKTALVFQVESLKDRLVWSVCLCMCLYFYCVVLANKCLFVFSCSCRLEDASQDYSEVKSELSREQSVSGYQI